MKNQTQAGKNSRRRRPAQPQPRGPAKIPAAEVTATISGLLAEMQNVVAEVAGSYRAIATFAVAVNAAHSEVVAAMMSAQLRASQIAAVILGAQQQVMEQAAYAAQFLLIPPATLVNAINAELQAMEAIRRDFSRSLESSRKPELQKRTTPE